MCFLKMFLAQVAHVAMFESSLWWATATLVVQQMISKSQFEKIYSITFLNVSPQIVSCARCNVWVRLGSLWWRNRRWTSGLVFQTRKQRFNKMRSFNVHLQAFFLMQVAFCIHCNGRVRNTWTGCQLVGCGTCVVRRNQGSTKEYRGGNILLSRHYHSASFKCDPFFLHSHNTQFEMVESSKSWWRRSSLIFQRGLQKSWPERKILWSSAKYCGASQKDYRCAKYQGAVQNIGAVPGNQKQDSIN